MTSFATAEGKPPVLIEQARTETIGRWATDVAFDKTAASIILTDNDRLIRYDVSTLRQTAVSEREKAPACRRILWRPDSDRFVVWTSTHGPAVFNEAMEKIGNLPQAERICDVTASISGDRVYIAKQSGIIEIRDKRNELLSAIKIMGPRNDGAIDSLHLLEAISRDDRTLFVVNNVNHTIQSINIESGSMQHLLELKDVENQGGLHISLSDDGSSILLYSTNSVFVIDSKTFKNLYRFKSSAAVQKAAISGNGQLIAVAYGGFHPLPEILTKDGVVEIHDVSKSKLVYSNTLTGAKRTDWLLFHPQKAALYVKAPGEIILYRIQ